MNLKNVVLMSAIAIGATSAANAAEETIRFDAASEQFLAL